jgi:salicylate hydroxylase
MAGARKPRIVVAGAGVAGSLIVSGLRDRADCELICLERVGPEDHSEAGTGLNIGPNAMKCLSLHLPREAAAIRANSLAWSRWTVALTSGETLMDLPLAEVADNPGIRIRWAELYALLRKPNAGRIAYGAEVTACGRQANGAFVTWTDRRTGERRDIQGVDLLIAADGRYSLVRNFVLGAPEVPRFLNVCLTRVLALAGRDCPIDDYGQWFNGPNRLLAFRVPGDLVYCTASFPIPPGSATPDAMKRPEFLERAYRSARGALSPQAAFIIDALVRHHESIHWARLQEGGVAFGETPGMLLTGDAAHPMAPTLGQGASQACEDACVVVDEIRFALAAGDPLAAVSQRVAERRAARVRFVVDFSREATDTMLAGSDPVEGTRRKTQPPFRAKLQQLYRDVPHQKYSA